MSKKPISPQQHAVIDYIFSGIQLGAPEALDMNKKVSRVYRLLGAKFLLVNALTDTPAGLKPVLSFKDHKKMDQIFLAGLSLLTFYKPIWKSKKALSFHLGILATAAAHYALTEYEEEQDDFEEMWYT